MISELVKQDLDAPINQGFTVTNLDSANWAFRKLRSIAEQKADYEELARKEIERINEWLKSELNSLESQELFFKGLLTEYAIKERQRDPKFKLSSPYGKLGFRKQQPKFNYQDEEIIKWCKESGKLALLRVKEELDKTALKKMISIHGSSGVTEDGEMVPGLEIVEQEEKINIEVM